MDSAPDSISGIEKWLHWNGDFDNPNDSEEDREEDNESDIQLNNMIKNPEVSEQRHWSAALNVPGLILSTLRSKSKVQKVFMMANKVETWRNEGNKK